MKEADNEVLEGIRITMTLIGQRRLKVEKSCTNFRAEIESYIWDKKAAARGEEAPVKEKDHCLTGDTMVDTVFGQKPIRNLVGKIGLVKCWNVQKKRKAWSIFWNVHKARVNAPVYEVETNDGRKFKATGDHLVLTQRGWIRVDKLSTEDVIIDREV